MSALCSHPIFLFPVLLSIVTYSPDLPCNSPFRDADAGTVIQGRILACEPIVKDSQPCEAERGATEQQGSVPSAVVTVRVLRSRTFRVYRPRCRVLHDLSSWSAQDSDTRFYVEAMACNPCGDYKTNGAELFSLRYPTHDAAPACTTPPQEPVPIYPYNLPALRPTPSWVEKELAVKK